MTLPHDLEAYIEHEVGTEALGGEAAKFYERVKPYSGEKQQRSFRKKYKATAVEEDNDALEEKLASKTKEEIREQLGGVSLDGSPKQLLRMLSEGSKTESKIRREPG